MDTTQALWLIKQSILAQADYIPILAQIFITACQAEAVAMAGKTLTHKHVNKN
jgi:hypothetical protein